MCWPSNARSVGKLPIIIGKVYLIHGKQGHNFSKVGKHLCVAAHPVGSRWREPIGWMQPFHRRFEKRGEPDGHGRRERSF